MRAVEVAMNPGSLDPQQSITDHTLCIIDPNLYDYTGHCYEYDHAILEACSEYNCQVKILGHQDVKNEITATMPVQRVFKDDSWYVNPILTCIPYKGWQINALFANLRFYWQLRSYLNRFVEANWIIFCHTISANQILGLALWLKYVPSHLRPKVILLLRYDVYWYRHKYAQAGFRMLAPFVQDGIVRLSSDSEALAHEYSRFTGLPVEVLPIPHTTRLPNSSLRLSLPDTDKRVFAFLGPARSEKGFGDILKSIKILQSLDLLDHFSFVLQLHDYQANEEEQKIIDELETLDNVLFIDRSLDSDEYYGLLNYADIILLPYWRSTYHSRTSGVLTEAIALGKPIVSTRNTWLGDQIAQYKSGVLCEDHSSYGLAHALINIDNNYEMYKTHAKRAMHIWLHKHNPSALVAALLR